MREVEKLRRWIVNQLPRFKGFVKDVDGFGGITSQYQKYFYLTDDYGDDGTNYTAFEDYVDAGCSEHLVTQRFRLIATGCDLFMFKTVLENYPDGNIEITNASDVTHKIFEAETGKALTQKGAEFIRINFEDTYLLSC